MKNLRKTMCLMMSLLLVFAVGGCAAANTPGTQAGTTGYGAIGTGTSIVPGTSAITPGTSAITGTNTAMNIGTNLRTNLRTNLGTAPGAITGNNLGTNLSATTNTMPGNRVVPNTAGTTGKVFKDGTYTATGVNGTDNVTVSVKGGKIVKVDFKAAHGKNVAGLKAIRDNISRQVISNQNTNVNIRGATKMTNDMISTVRKALDKAKV